MSPFPFCVPPGVLAKQQPIDDIVYPVSPDSLVAVWRDEGGLTTDIYQSVDNTGAPIDDDYAKLRSANWILTECPTTASRSLRFKLGNPSGAPSPYQTVRIAFRSKIVDPYTTGFTATVDVKLKEGTSTVRSSSTGNTVTATFGTDFSVLSIADINSVTDWDDLYAEATWDVCANGVDADLDIYCSHVYLEFIS